MTKPANSEIAETPENSNQRPRFTIRSIMVITLIVAVAAAAAGRLYMAANGQTEQIGPFVIATSMAPLGLMILINWFFRLLGRL